jgi:hypothetical protein
MKKEWAAACGAALLISVGCAESKAPAPAASAAPATTTAAPAATTPAIATAADSEFGVPE